mmetsp:Transcript_32407/g.66162  ORF Transcript_32407/g.66162 Transcript_32407/m.66162 type:complete len:90 (-) Transcript_32407:41-310(-)
MVYRIIPIAEDVIGVRRWADVSGSQTTNRPLALGEETRRERTSALRTSNEFSSGPRMLSQHAHQWCRDTFETLRTNGWSKRAARAAAFV